MNKLNRKRVISSLIVLLLIIFILTPTVFAQKKHKTESLTIEELYELAKKEIKRQSALNYTAYPYLGWRTSGGPWYNAVLDWIEHELKTDKFEYGEDTEGDNYWIQEDIEERVIWDPGYASLEIIGPEGDDNFDFILNTFNPLSEYYPKDLTYEWVKDNIGSERETSMNERCRLATNSGFTDSIGTNLEDAVGITAEAIYVGQVYRDSQTRKYYWTENTDADLTGKIIFATNSRANAYRLALQEGAAVSLCSQINDYNNPIIDGKELYPNTVKYAGVSNSSADNPVAFNLSPADERYLISLFEDAEKPIYMRAVAIGNFYPQSEERPLKTLIAEIKGTSKKHERVIFVAHVQEPGACDNASGVGLQLEVIKALKKMIHTGKLPRPKRTMTFIWGDEYNSTYKWRDAHPEEMKNVTAALVLDMVGEDPEKTGGSMRIEKTPDPSAYYVYGVDLLPGQEEPEMKNAYVRKPDKHTLWGAGRLGLWPYPGLYLNDLYFKAASLVSEDFPDFVVGSNPWEGGSDHDPFLWHKEGNEYTPIPALLSWHFTDYVYHSSMDTLGTVSRDELRNVGITTVCVGTLIANADEKEASQIMDIVRERADWRFDWEMLNSEGHLNWAYEKAIKDGKSGQEIADSIDKALELEIEILNAWGTWYKGAVESAGSLCSETSEEYMELKSEYLNEINDIIKEAVINAENIAEGLKYNILDIAS